MPIKEDAPLIKEIKELFTKINNIDPGSLIREEELGKALSFSNFFDDFTRIINNNSINNIKIYYNLIFR